MLATFTRVAGLSLPYSSELQSCAIMAALLLPTREFRFKAPGEGIHGNTIEKLAYSHQRLMYIFDLLILSQIPCAFFTEGD